MAANAHADQIASLAAAAAEGEEEDEDDPRADLVRQLEESHPAASVRRPASSRTATGSTATVFRAVPPEELGDEGHELPAAFASSSSRTSWTRSVRC